MFLHLGLIVGLSVTLTWARLMIDRRGEASKNDCTRADGDRPCLRASSAICANQFEAPVFAWIAAFVLILSDAVTVWDTVAAWTFLAGRLIHTAVQCSGDSVALHGQVFTINFLGLPWLMAHTFMAIVGAV